MLYWRRFAAREVSAASMMDDPPHPHPHPLITDSSTPTSLLCGLRSEGRARSGEPRGSLPRPTLRTLRQWSDECVPSHPVPVACLVRLSL